MQKTLKNILYCLLTLTTASANAITINYGLVDESYPTSRKIFGKAPNSQAAQLGVQAEAEMNWEPVGIYYLNVEAIGRYEPNPTKYDRERHPVSLEGNFSLVKPILKSIAQDSFSLITGGKVQMNGPQYNDNYRDLFVGAQIKQRVQTNFGPMQMTAILGYVKYFYEVDDEPAFDQTATTRELLTHSGSGRLLVVQAEYRAGTNTLRLTYNEINANDRLQGGRYQKRETGLALERALSDNSSCAIELKVIQHEYTPVALAHPDRMNSTQVKCSRRF